MPPANTHTHTHRRTLDPRGGFTPLEKSRPKAADPVRDREGSQRLPVSNGAEAARRRRGRSLTGFTLVELLIVIGIIAALSSFTLLILNPAEMLRQARDSTRMVDTQTINKALGLYETMGGSSFGSASTVYVSIPDTSATCSSLGLPSLPSGWAYSCKTTALYRKVDGTGWIPVNFTSVPGGSNLSVLPIDPINATTTGLYYTYVTGGSWKLTAVSESQKYVATASKDGGTSGVAFEIGTNLALAAGIFPGGWTRAPSRLLVMQYEAKYDKNGDGQGDDASTAGCVASSGDGLDWSDIGCNTAANVVSTENGSPIVTISHTQAVSACAAIGARLINNQEWMAIARDAEQIAGNWSSGTVGTGCLFRGNVGSTDACGYNGADPEKGAGRNTKAKLALSNGMEIWDIAGNALEHVMKDAADTLVGNLPTDGGVAGWRWIAHTAITGYGDLSYDEVRPSDSSWNSSQGMGSVYTYNGAIASRVLLRGGYWPDSSNAGAFSLYLAWNAGSTNYNMGFRCAR
ncbi:MAG: type II secretion system protein [bacterium]|nr:type II secretion system protein [bacterium]